MRALALAIVLTLSACASRVESGVVIVDCAYLAERECTALKTAGVVLYRGGRELIIIGATTAVHAYLQSQP